VEKAIVASGVKIGTRRVSVMLRDAEDWVELFDTSTMAVYYHNNLTGKDRTTMPDEMVTSAVCHCPVHGCVLVLRERVCCAGVVVSGCAEAWQGGGEGEGGRCPEGRAEGEARRRDERGRARRSSAHGDGYESYSACFAGRASTTDSASLALTLPPMQDYHSRPLISHMLSFPLTAAFCEQPPSSLSRSLALAVAYTLCFVVRDHRSLPLCRPSVTALRTLALQVPDATPRPPSRPTPATSRACRTTTRTGRSRARGSPR
jgi:hypothetical protein